MKWWLVEQSEAVTFKVTGTHAKHQKRVYGKDEVTISKRQTFIKAESAEAAIDKALKNSFDDFRVKARPVMRARELTLDAIVHIMDNDIDGEWFLDANRL
jgi:hypothetical protein